jgi:hypothetical protein
MRRRAFPAADSASKWPSSRSASGWQRGRVDPSRQRRAASHSPLQRFRYTPRRASRGASPFLGPAAFAVRARAEQGRHRALPRRAVRLLASPPGSSGAGPRRPPRRSARRRRPASTGCPHHGALHAGASRLRRAERRRGRSAHRRELRRVACRRAGADRLRQSHVARLVGRRGRGRRHLRRRRPSGRGSRRPLRPRSQPPRPLRDVDLSARLRRRPRGDVASVAEATMVWDTARWDQHDRVARARSRGPADARAPNGDLARRIAIAPITGEERNHLLAPSVDVAEREPVGPRRAEHARGHRRALLSATRLVIHASC